MEGFTGRLTRAQKRAARAISRPKEEAAGLVGELALPPFIPGDSSSPVMEVEGRRYFIIDWFAWLDEDGTVVDLDEVLAAANSRGQRRPPPDDCAVCGGDAGHRCAVDVGVSHDGRPPAERQLIAWVGDGTLLWAVCDHLHEQDPATYEESALACAYELAHEFQRGERPIPAGGARVRHQRPYDGGGLRRRQPTGLSAKVWREMVAAADGRCAYCERRMEDLRWLQREHDIPLSRCGQNHVDNIVVACARDNRRKGTMTGAEYRQFLQLMPWPD